MNIFIGNLPLNITDQELKKIFEKYGEVPYVEICKKNKPPFNELIGFVEMPDKNEAIEAIRQINGKIIKGRKARVNKARAIREDRRTHIDRRIMQKHFQGPEKRSGQDRRGGQDRRVKAAGN